MNILNLFITNYTITQNCTIDNQLFLNGDKLYIQNYDPVNFSPRSVFGMDRKFLFYMSNDLFDALVEKKTIVESVIADNE